MTGNITLIRFRLTGVNSVPCAPDISFDKQVMQMEST